MNYDKNGKRVRASISTPSKPLNAKTPSRKGMTAKNRRTHGNLDYNQQVKATSVEANTADNNTLVKSGVLDTSDAKFIDRPINNNGQQKVNKVSKFKECDHIVPMLTKKDSEEQNPIWLKYNHKVSEKNGRTYNTIVIKSFFPREEADQMTYHNDKGDEVKLVIWYKGRYIVNGEKQIEMFEKCIKTNNKIEVFK